MYVSALAVQPVAFVTQSFPFPVWLIVHPAGSAGGVMPVKFSENTVIAPPA
jgi:hypothetical protein